MASWKGKTRGGVFGYKFFIAIIKYSNISVAYFFLRFVAVYFLFFSQKKFIFNFYYKILKYNFFTSFIKIYQNYCALGQVLIDKVAVLSGFYDNFTYDFDGEEHLKQMVETNSGGILISAHIGNWEIAGHFLKRFNCKFNLLMIDAEHQKIKKYLSSVLKEKDVNIIVIKDDLSHIFQISNALRNKEIVCFHGDRYVEGSKTVSCDFLGKKAHFPSGPYYTAIAFNVPVFFIAAMKEAKTHYHFYARPLKRHEYSYNKQKREDSMKIMVNEYAGELGKIVRKYPLQWFNYYDFWKGV